MARRGGGAPTYVCYYGEVPDEDDQHAIHARPMSADLPDGLAWEVAHGRCGIEGPTMTDDCRCILGGPFLQEIGEP